MMRRRGIFAGLYGLIDGVLAAAQVSNPDRPRPTPAEGWRRKPDNNECPVCGTVAPTLSANYGWHPCNVPAGHVTLEGCMVKDLSPLWQQVRCQFCNVTFWQVAEERAR